MSFRNCQVLRVKEDSLNQEIRFRKSCGAIKFLSALRGCSRGPISLMGDKSIESYGAQSSENRSLRPWKNPASLPGLASLLLLVQFIDSLHFPLEEAPSLFAI